MRTETCLTVAVPWLILTACYPAAIPPSRLAIGTGVATDQEQRPKPALDLRWSVQPLGVVEYVRSRRVDVGMGYGATVSSVTTHGPELFGEYFFIPGRAHGTGWRAGLLGSAQVLFATVDERPSQGFGGSLGIDLEHTGFALPEKDVAQGEWALGGYATARYGEVDGFRCWSFVAGLEARVPLMAR